MFVDIRTLARLRSTYQALTPAQRVQLKSIVECQYQELSAPDCEILVSLGLVRLDGDQYWNEYIATEDGSYVARLL